MKTLSMRGKTLVITVLVLTILIAALYVTSHIILLGSFRRLEAQNTLRNVERVRDALAGDIGNLDDVTNDYGAWDDSYAFIEDGNEDFIRTNLPHTTFMQLRVDLMAFVHHGGRVVFAASYDHRSGEPRLFPESFRNILPELLRRLDAEGRVKGIVMLPEGPLLLAARPILTSERQGPSHGTVFMGRYLDAGEVDRLSAVTHLSLTLHPWSASGLPPDLQTIRPLLSRGEPILARPLDGKTIAGYSLLSDAFGQQALLLRVDLHREILEQGQKSIRYFMLWMTAIGLGFGGFAHWLAGQLALSRQRQEQSEQRLTFVETHHPVTGLPNRSLVLDLLRQALAYAKRNSLSVAVLHIDLDHFKIVNESLGHLAGDHLLETIASRLTECCRGEDTIAHLGGDEFMVIVPDLLHAQRAATVARKILAAVSRPSTLAGKEIVVTASIGITVAPLDADDAETLLKNADTAVYQAKSQGRDTYQFFASEMNDRTRKRLELESDLRRALEREEFLLHYQPRVDIATGAIIGMEALVRWQHPERGLVPPLDFIPLAEETGLILPIGEWVLQAACAQNRAWQLSGAPALRVSVNLSGRQLRQPDLIRRIEKILAETGMATKHLELEITESVLMENVEKTIAVLSEIRGMGIALAMDDFGTGYSSLSYLKRFPFDHVKIDYSFVRDLTRNASDATLVRTIISMAHNLNLRSVAEGVETEEQLAFLRQHGCDEVQGYYFSRPVPAVEFVKLLREPANAGGASPEALTIPKPVIVGLMKAPTKPNLP